MREFKASRLALIAILPLVQRLPMVPKSPFMTQNGVIAIDLFEDIAPAHAAQTALAADGAYDVVVFHRVIDGFTQTGDVQFAIPMDGAV
jgi:hypothetical protein